MRMTKNTLRVAAWMALIVSAGYVLALPIFFGFLLIDAHDTSVARSSGTGAVFVLALPVFFLLRWLKKRPFVQ